MAVRRNRSGSSWCSAAGEELLDRDGEGDRGFVHTSSTPSPKASTTATRPRSAAACSRSPPNSPSCPAGWPTTSLPRQASGLVRSELLGLESRAYAQLGDSETGNADRSAQTCVAVYGETPRQDAVPDWIHYMNQAEVALRNM